MDTVRYRNSYLILSLTAFTVVVVLVGAPFVLSTLQQEYLPALALTLLLGVIAVFPIRRLLRQGKFDLFHPLVLVSVFGILPFYVFKGLMLIFFDAPSPYLWRGSYQPRNLAIALLYVCIGFASMMAGYYLPIGKALVKHLPRLRKWDFESQQLWVPVVFLFLFSTSLTLYPSIRVGGLQSVVAFFLEVLNWVYFLVAYLAFRNQRSDSRKWKILLVVLVTEQLFFATFSGARGAWIYKVAWPVLAGFQFTLPPSSRLRKLSKPLFISFLLLMSGFLFSTILRTTYREGIQGLLSGSGINAIQDTLSHITGSSLMANIELFWESFLERLSQIDAVVSIVALAPTLEPEGANTIIPNLGWGLIPRFLYAAKPEIDQTVVEWGRLYFAGGASSYITHASVTYIGSLYRNFFFWGIPLGMALLGISLRTIYAWLIEDKPPSSLQLMIYVAIIQSVGLGSHYASFYTSILRRGIILFLVCTFIQVLVKVGRMGRLQANHTVRSGM